MKLKPLQIQNKTSKESFVIYKSYILAPLDTNSKMKPGIKRQSIFLRIVINFSTKINKLIEKLIKDFILKWFQRQ